MLYLSELPKFSTLQNGQIFMFTGMLNKLPNDDSLATILGHEMSHAILQHGVNILTFSLLICKY